MPALPYAPAVGGSANTLTKPLPPADALEACGCAMGIVDYYHTLEQLLTGRAPEAVLETCRANAAFAAALADRIRQHAATTGVHCGHGFRPAAVKMCPTCNPPAPR